MNGKLHAVRCQAIVKRRDHKGEPKRQGQRCHHSTLRGIYCWQHENTIRHFRITETNTLTRKGYGLITTLSIPKGRLICLYDGVKVVTDHPDLKNPFLLKIKKRPATYIDATEGNVKEEGRWIKPSPSVNKTNCEIIVQNGKAYVYSTQDILPKSEILCNFQQKRQAPVIIKPVAPRVQRPRKPKLPVNKQDVVDRKYETKLIIRLQLIQKLMTDRKLVSKFGLKYNPKLAFTIPKRYDNTDVYKYHKTLNYLLKQKEKRLMAYFNTVPNNQFTMNKLRDTIDALIARKKPKMQAL